MHLERDGWHRNTAGFAVLETIVSCSTIMQHQHTSLPNPNGGNHRAHCSCPSPFTMVEPNPVDENYINDTEKVSKDMKRVKHYVKNDLFLKVIDIFNDNQFEEGSWMHKDYMKNCRIMLTGRRIGERLTENEKSYMKFLWTKMKSEKCYKKWLASKRSNAYQAVQDRFNRECHLALLETLS